MRSIKTFLNAGFATALGAATLGAYAPKEAAAQQIQGGIVRLLSLPDIGLQLIAQPEGFMVTGVLKDGMAYQQGIQFMSYIVEVNDRPIVSIPPSELPSLFSAANAQSVKLKISPYGTPSPSSNLVVMNVPLKFTGKMTDENLIDEPYRAPPRDSLPPVEIVTPDASKPDPSTPNYYAEDIAPGYYGLVSPYTIIYPDRTTDTIKPLSCGYYDGEIASDNRHLLYIRLPSGVWQIPVERGNLSPIFDQSVNDETCNGVIDVPESQKGWGIGLELGVGYDGRAIVKSVMKGGPADRAGFCVGETILAFERHTSFERQGRVSLGGGNSQGMIDRWNKQLSDWYEGIIVIGRMRGNTALPTEQMDKRWAQGTDSVRPPCPQ